ncbi:DUF397 domain-containing protein [Streptomyces sp. JW3]|uniref:DUF397 domain-containing protein n=1 Tax=Streptomyces sp. JW3 TaxID=3456955 RepID=UPI003FA45617
MPIQPNWRTSSHTETTNCVEVADNDPTRVLVRDTKNRDYGYLTLNTASWGRFVEATKRRDLER